MKAKAAALRRDLRRSEELQERVPSQVTEEWGGMVGSHQLSQGCWLPSSWEEFIYLLQFPKMGRLPECLEMHL